MKNKNILISALCLSILLASALGNAQPPQANNIDNARAAAPMDLTGTWVSIVTEDWRYRIITAEAGDIDDGYALTELGTRIAESWNPAADEAMGEACKAYGAAGIMRQPTRLQINWENDNVLKIDTDAGMQTRLLKFGAAQDGTGIGTWQGVSNANWKVRPQGRGEFVITDTLEIKTHGMRPGYLLRNGIPYSDQASMQEYFDLITQDDGSEYLIVLSIVEDPVFLAAPAITSSTFRREADNSSWKPTECLVE
tara:strand:- start:37878 stop:38636 length:759 start_codon:yes stop_codon:yes gene_type:complete